jgi:hypothetical protein
VRPAKILCQSCLYPRTIKIGKSKQVSHILIDQQARTLDTQSLTIPLFITEWPGVDSGSTRNIADDSKDDAGMVDCHGSGIFDLASYRLGHSYARVT